MVNETLTDEEFNQAVKEGVDQAIDDLVADIERYMRRDRKRSAQPTYSGKEEELSDEEFETAVGEGVDKAITDITRTSYRPHTKPNPIALERLSGYARMGKWQEYGFRSLEEASLYSQWVMGQLVFGKEPKTVEQVLRQYPIERFRELHQ